MKGENNVCMVAEISVHQKSKGITHPTKVLAIYAMEFMTDFVHVTLACEDGN